MDKHPGGDTHTIKMLSLSGLSPGSSILDMGAGAGETMKLLSRLGYQVEGIDLFPQSSIITKGDFLSPPYPDNSFDGIISQCSFYLSKNIPVALAQANRLLRQGGILMLSDVCPDRLLLERCVENSGFAIRYTEDLTSIWKEYYIQAIWNGTAPKLSCCEKFSYQMLICERN